MEVTNRYASIPQVETGNSKFAATGTDADKLRLDFLKLMTAQLEYQDPLEPLENTEFTSQMAQFTSLSEQQRSNQILEQLLGTQNINQLNNAVSYIGKSVVTDGNRAKVADGQTTIHFNMPDKGAADIHLYDASGRLVKSLETRVFEAGEQGLDISDATLANGIHTFSVVMPGGEGEAAAVGTLEKGIVTGVVNDASGVTLEMNGRRVQLAEIRRVEQAGS